MFDMVFTESTGYWPTAVSADSITASAPSKTAVATSEASALVGTGVLIIDSSICVATITGLPKTLQAIIIFFWIPGTLEGGNSTPKSPLATIIPSDNSIIWSKSFSAEGFSILEISGFLFLIIFFTYFTSSTFWTKDKAIQSISFSKIKVKSFLSFAVIGFVSKIKFGRFTPLLLERLPPTKTLVFNISFFLDNTFNFILPSSINIMEFVLIDL